MPGRARAFFASLLAVGTLLLSPPALGEASDCAVIADHSARLQCFTAVQEIRATVGRVIDGDTIDICIGGNCMRVRLCGIDAPERGERGYSEATDALRNLAQCFLRDADIGGIVVRRGLACDWERFSGGHYSRKGGARC